MCSDPTTNYPIHEWAHALRGSYPILGWHLTFRVVINNFLGNNTPHTLNKSGVLLPWC
jgi:hypothetical protein